MAFLLAFFLFFFALPAGTKSSFSQSGTSATIGGGSTSAAACALPALGFFLFFFALPAGTKSSFSQSRDSATGSAFLFFFVCFACCEELPPLLFFFLFALDAGTKSSFSQSSASPARVSTGAARTGRLAAVGRSSAARPPLTAERNPAPGWLPETARVAAACGTAAIAAPANMF